MSFTVIVGLTLSYTNSYVVSFPATSFNVIVFLPYTSFDFILSKFASDHLFGVTFTYSVSFILYAATSYSSYSLKLTLEYTFLSLFPTNPSFTVIVGATLSYTNSYVAIFPALSLT